MKNLTCLMLSALVLAGTGLRAEHQDSWLVRLRGVNLDTASKSDSVPDLYIPADVINTSNKTLPELDFTYCFSPNFATELTLAAPQSHTVNVEYAAINGIGSFKEMPTCLIAQYRFTPDSLVDFYMGVGVNYMRFSSVNLNMVGEPLALGKYSLGAVFQTGLDIKVADHWFVNLDLRYLNAKTDINIEGAKLSALNLSPMLYGVGVGFSF